MIAKYRILRQKCNIPLGEVAAEANISPQRLGQFETRYYGFKPKDPERLIKAFETVLARHKKEIEKAEHLCKHRRSTLFDYVQGDVEK